MLVYLTFLCEKILILTYDILLSTHLLSHMVDLKGIRLILLN